MSRLRNSLKNNIDFNKKTNIYLSKSFIKPHEIKVIKDFHGQRRIDSAIQHAIEFFVFKKIDNQQDLFKQIEYRTDLENFLYEFKQIEKKYNYHDLTNDFYKISILYWHLIFCLSNYGNANHFTSIEELVEGIIRFNENSFYNLFPEKG